MVPEMGLAHNDAMSVPHQWAVLLTLPALSSVSAVFLNRLCFRTEVSKTDCHRLEPVKNGMGGAQDSASR